MNAWQPERYHRFQAERTLPFRDLLDLIEPVPGGAAVDLGCGTGELTVDLHRHLGVATTVGVDSSRAMLERAIPLADGAVTFVEADISRFGNEADFDVVAANASLQWVPDHPRLLARLAGLLRRGGQLAFQVPANADHPSHRLAAELASGELAHLFEGPAPPDPVREVLSPEVYAELLHDLGAVRQHVRLQVYGHELESAREVVAWVQGTSLTRFERVLAPAAYQLFVDRYREVLLGELGERSPYFYAFKRILAWGRW